jgi:hypothetical protein
VLRPQENRDHETPEQAEPSQRIEAGFKEAKQEREQAKREYDCTHRSHDGTPDDYRAHA